MIYIRCKRTKKYNRKLFFGSVSSNITIITIAIMMIFYIVVSAICDYGFNFITIISGAVIWSIGSYAVKFIFSIDEKIIRQLNKKSFRLINNLQNNYNNIKYNHQEQIVLKKLLNEYIEFELNLYENCIAVVKIPLVNIFLGNMFSNEERLYFVLDKLPPNIKLINHISYGIFCKLTFRFIY